MNIKSLMVGDWVQFKTYGVSDKFEKTEAYIFVKVAEIGSGLITVEYNNDIKEPYRICENTEIEPIPLTPEILEKNGFIHYDVTDFWMWKEESSEPIHLDNYDKDGWRLRINCDNIPCECKFVHQLQHALRLCGIDKTIEL